MTFTRLRLAKADLMEGALEGLPPEGVQLLNAYQIASHPKRIDWKNVHAVREWIISEAASDGPGG